MRIQLLYPPTLISLENIQSSRPTPPLGLAYIAATLRQAGHECSVIDGLAEAPTQTSPARGGVARLGLSDEQILARIDPEARAIGITCIFSFNWPELRELIRAIRVRYPDKIIVCGGEHFTALPEVCMAETPIDYIVMGEGEEIATELFAKLDSGRPFDPAAIKGLCWRRGDEIVRNPRAERTRRVDEIPWPAWDLFDLDAYNANDLIGGLNFGKMVPILATRGCPYQCTYCSSPQMWTTRWYARDPVDVADEIELYVQRYGARSFPFQDLTMIVRKDWIVQFCNEIINRGLDIAWQLPTGTRCEVLDDEVAELLQRSGCRWLGFSPESGSERTRELIKKRMKTSSLMDAVDACVRAGLHLSTAMVIGFPHDTADHLRETARVARQLARKGVEDLAVHFFYPLPSTELHNYLLARGRIRVDDVSLMAPLFGMRYFLADELNFCEHLPSKELTRWKFWIQGNFYLIAWATHPMRVLRILSHAVTGKQTSSMERLLAERMPSLIKRLRPKQQRTASASGNGTPVTREARPQTIPPARPAATAEPAAAAVEPPNSAL